MKAQIAKSSQVDIHSQQIMYFPPRECHMTTQCGVLICETLRWCSRSSCELVEPRPICERKK